MSTNLHWLDQMISIATQRHAQSQSCNFKGVSINNTFKVKFWKPALFAPYQHKSHRKIKAVATFLGHSKGLKMLTKLEFGVAS
jgi:hypothetical protein